MEEQTLDPILQILERSSDLGMRVCVHAHAQSLSCV